ncbi:MAG: GTPase [Candidatus Omnitrophota bacterium]|nr:GTPase [Candidatus Omnitrophota bacterium]
MTVFVDHMRVAVQAGNGGNGCASFSRRDDRKVVPDGADGGDGGRIIFRADTNAPPLVSLRSRQYIIAESGGHGKGARKRGRNGESTVIIVPVGTRIYDRDKNLLIRQLTTSGSEVVVCEGGRGGSGNSGHRDATLGEKKGPLSLELQYRVPADIFLVGLPNSGKSTFLNRLTRAHVKIEYYPFTTRTPEVGVLSFSEYEQLTLCELPSLYAASGEGRGMGADFLKHLEVANLVLYFLDPQSEFATSLEDGLAILKSVVEAQNSDFLNIPYAVVVNKIDIAEAKASAEKQAFDPGVPCFYISAQQGEGLKPLNEYLKEVYETSQDA